MVESKTFLEMPFILSAIREWLFLHGRHLFVHLSVRPYLLLLLDTSKTAGITSEDVPGPI